MNKEHEDPDVIDLDAPRLGTSRKRGRNIKTLCIWSTSNLLKKKEVLSSIKHDRTQSSFTTRSQLVASRRLSWWGLEKSYTRKYMRHLDLSRRCPLKTIGWKNWVQKLLEVFKTPNKPNQRPNIQVLEQGDLFWQSNHPVRVLRKSTNVSYLAAKARMIEQGDLSSSCVPVSVERSDQDKDADENEDADHVRTERPVESEQSTGYFTQLEVLDIDFRVSGLPHAAVKQAEDFRVRELVKKIESHPHRQDLQADLQQNNAYNPLVKKSKKMIREMGNVELFELCETIPKVQCTECLLYWNQAVIYCTCGHLLVESEPSQNFHQRRLDAFSIQNYVIKKERPRGARHSKTEALKEHFVAHNARRRCLKKKFEGIHDRFQRDSAFLNSKLAGLRRSASRWTNLHRKTTPVAHPLRSSRDFRKTGLSHLNKSGRNAPMKLRSDFREGLTEMHRLHCESGEERPEPIPFCQYQIWYSSSSSSSTSWWQRNEWTLVELKIKESQFPLSSGTEQHLRTVRPVKDAHSSRNSEWNDDKNWFSEEWKSDELMEVRNSVTCLWTTTGLVHTAHGQIYCWWRYGLWHRRRIRHVVKIQIILAQCEWSSAKDSGTQDNNKHSLICVRLCLRQYKHLYSWERITWKFLHSVRNTGTDVRHIWKVGRRTIRWDLWKKQLTGVILHGNIYLWLVMKKSSVSRTRRCTYFRILCDALERWARTHNQILSGRTSWRGSKVHHNTELWTQMMVSQWNSSEIFSLDSPHCSSATKCKGSCQQWTNSQKNSQDGSSSCRRSTTSPWWSTVNEQECELSAKLVLIFARRFSPGRWSLLGPGSERSGMLLMNASHKEDGT